jgi:hypothetical protein
MEVLPYRVNMCSGQNCYAESSNKENIKNIKIYKQSCVWLLIKLLNMKEK